MREKKPDLFRALSLLKAARIRHDFCMGLVVSDESASTIVSEIYESFRMQGEALLIAEGKESIGSESHTFVMNALIALRPSSQRPAQVLLNLKDIRNKMNYKGYIALAGEATEAKDIATSLFNALESQIKTQVQKS